jgi:hypothetical protein
MTDLLDLRIASVSVEAQVTKKCNLQLISNCHRMSQSLLES